MAAHGYEFYLDILLPPTAYSHLYLIIGLGELYLTYAYLFGGPLLGGRLGGFG